jgi:cyclopropane fatty-acyl-phospholipid synthase-like methyltransferase
MPLGVAANSGGRLLDVGCGKTGAMIRVREFGWLVEGIDSDAAAPTLH